jgi:hypothetical protein
LAIAAHVFFDGKLFEDKGANVPDAAGRGAIIADMRTQVGA